MLMPGMEEDRVIDYNRIAAEYARHRQIHPGVFRNIVETAGVKAGSTVLDVGCGTGNYLVALEKATACRVYGIDPSEEMLARARPRSGTIEFKIGRAESLDFPDAAFDLVMSTDVIHHVQGRAQYFAEAFRVLKPGGRLCTMTDSEWVIHHRKPLTYYFPESEEIELKRYPGMATLKELLAAAGFQAIREDLEQFAYELADIQAYRDKAFSSLHLISGEAHRRGLARMEEDLKAGPIKCIAYYTVLWGTKP